MKKKRKRGGEREREKRETPRKISRVESRSPRRGKQQAVCIRRVTAAVLTGKKEESATERERESERGKGGRRRKREECRVLKSSFGRKSATSARCPSTGQRIIPTSNSARHFFPVVRGQSRVYNAIPPDPSHLLNPRCAGRAIMQSEEETPE